MLSLEQRHSLSDITFLYKALHGYINVDVRTSINLYTDADHYVLRSNGDGIRLNKNYARTNVFKYSYFNRITESWNSLPNNIRMAPNLRVIVREIRAKSKNLERWGSADLPHTNIIGRLGGLVDKYT